MFKKALVLAIASSFMGIITSCSLIPTSLTTAITGTTTGTPTTTTSSSSTSTSTTKLSTSDIKTACDAFAKRFETEGKTPEGSIKMLFEALLTIETSPELAEVEVSVTLNGKDMYEDATSVSGYDVGSTTRYMLEEIKNKYRIARSYVGAVPDDDYVSFDKNNIVVNFPANGTLVNGLKVDNTITADSTSGRVYVKSSGKDLPTPIYMEKNSKGLWKISSGTISSIATGVKGKPKDF